ncbi:MULTISPECIES: cell division protein FtsL [Ralstonia]|uniref:Cell division protein FtsL n=1 Tax=Ralstonia mannitolilytica TaxID=105219 RepID=A0AAJ4ZN04_9RALS|nr:MULTISPECIES: cell division protein FtsL [Ralstonia]ATG18862.1 cell division protein FtsL [Ralstonia pickettii]AJW44328.1 cell division protein FtsL [Ralstonia mannitolilytica]MBU9577580.1 cell division protein FtsL [Ralstonia mannitolilytica]PLT20169.1 cell division protein FtsL [Ralstonia mannitolilytica]QIF08494.1 cell division protein FtsL [Ralstonia mannitolilytica]
MNRLNMFLLTALVLCALSLVNAQHQARQLFVALDRAQAEEKQLNIDWSRLQYEQSALGKSARIADIASRQLKMAPAQAGRTQYLQGFADMPTTEASSAAASAPTASGVQP